VLQIREVDEGDGQVLLALLPILNALTVLQRDDAVGIRACLTPRDEVGGGEPLLLLLYYELRERLYVPLRDAVLASAAEPAAEGAAMPVVAPAAASETAQTPSDASASQTRFM